MRRRALAVAAAVAALALGGCAGGDSDRTAPAGGTTAPAPPARVADGKGLRVGLPEGFDGRIARSAGPGARAVLQAANFPLPPPGGDDLAGAAVERIPPDGVLIAVIEMGPDVLGSVLYSAQGVPAIAPGALAPNVAPGPIPEGAGGVQRFFTASGRPFQLYVAVGSLADAESLAAAANAVLRSLRVAPRR